MVSVMEVEVEAVVEVVTVVGVEGATLVTGLKVALRSSSQGGMRCLLVPPSPLTLTHLKWTSRYFSTRGQSPVWKRSSEALTVQEDLPPQTLSRTDLLDRWRHSPREAEEGEVWGEVQTLVESLP